jgi:hypothetical protein
MTAAEKTNWVGAWFRSSGGHRAQCPECARYIAIFYTHMVGHHTVTHADDPALFPAFVHRLHTPTASSLVASSGVCVRGEAPGR